MYYKGQGVLHDYAEAVKWYRLSAEQGDAYAQFMLGILYDRGLGVPQDYAEAVRWYTRAAKQGNAEAQRNLGYMYKDGQGILQDHISAHMWFNIGSANGDESAGERRDKLAARMTAADIAKAQAMARDCMKSGYKNCGD